MTFPTLALCALFSVCALFASRRIAALSIMAGICYTSISQQIELGGMTFTAIRIILLIATARIMIRGEFRDLKLITIDWLVIVFTSVIILTATIRSGDAQDFIYQLGQSYNIVLSYITFRCFLKTSADLEGFFRGLAFLIMPLAILMIVHSITGENLLPGAVDLSESYVRGGRIRCNGSFLGPITAGIFGATLMPPFVGLYNNSPLRRIAMIGVLSTIAITLASNSSGPLMTLVVGSMGLMFWPLRERMRVVRRGIVAVLICLALIMNAPLWYLPAKLSGLTGGDGWHRSYLMEQAIRHFPDWWLLGTSDTSDWMPYKMAAGGADITNQYISVGINGGLIGLIIFISIIVISFRNLGQAMKDSRTKSLFNEFLLWSFGAVLCAHVVALTSVTYFDQMGIAWWVFLAILSSSSSEVLRDNNIPSVQYRKSQTRLAIHGLGHT